MGCISCMQKETKKNTKSKITWQELWMTQQFAWADDSGKVHVCYASASKGEVWSTLELLLVTYPGHCASCGKAFVCSC
jgi:hypothetical protein